MEVLDPQMHEQTVEVIQFPPQRSVPERVVEQTVWDRFVEPRLDVLDPLSPQDRTSE